MYPIVVDLEDADIVILGVARRTRPCWRRLTSRGALCSTP
jgi:hypothetical protein